MCLPLPRTMRPDSQRPLLRWSLRLLAEMEFQPCSRDRLSIRQGIYMRTWYRSIALVVLPLPAIYHIPSGCLSLPSTRSLQPGLGLMELMLRPRQQPKKPSISIAQFVFTQQTYRLSVERSNECVTVPIFCSSDWRF